MDVSSQNLELYSSVIHKLRSNLLNCFPENNYDVFISYFHNDVLIAKRVACWLKTEFGIDDFIDSTI